MKLPALIFLGFLFLLPAQAQKCAYISNTVSGMDGTRLVITEPRVYTTKSDFGTVDVWAKLHMDSVMVLSFVLRGSNAITVHQGDSLLLVGEGNEIHKLKIMQDASRQKDVTRSITLYSLVNNAEYLTMKGALISSIQICTEDGWIKLESDTKAGAKAIHRVLGCVQVFLAD